MTLWHLAYTTEFNSSFEESVIDAIETYAYEDGHINADEASAIRLMYDSANSTEFWLDPPIHPTGPSVVSLLSSDVEDCLLKDIDNQDPSMPFTFRVWLNNNLDSTIFCSHIYVWSN